MTDLDDELAALEAEVENEAKLENKKNGGNKVSYNNKNTNYGNNVPKTQPKKNNANDYEGYGNDDAGLEDFLNSNDNNYQNNNNYNNYNYNYQNNINNGYTNSNYMNQNNKYNNYNNNANRTNNYNNNNNSNYYQNNNYNNYNNPQKNNAQYNYHNNNHSNVSHTSKNQNQINSGQYNTQVKPKHQNQNQAQNQPKIDPKNSSKTQVITKSQEPKEDIYPVKQENMYHKLKEMKSLTVLEEEIALCDKIIAFKKKRGLEYDNWETKRGLAQDQLNNTKTLIEQGSINFESYKKLIMKELAYEKKILTFTESDKVSKPYELNEIKRRIEQRINAINKELSQNIEETNEEPPKQEQKSSSNYKGPNNSQKSTSNETASKTTMNPKAALAQNIPMDSVPENKASTQVITNNKNQLNPKTQPMNQIPKQYIIQQKVLVTDPKTGKQMYVMKNFIDPKYEKALKQQAILANQNKTAVISPNPQHIIQQKVLVTDPKTGKQMYVMKNVVDPKYAQQKQVPKEQINNMNPKTVVASSKNNLKLEEQKEAQNKMKEEIKKYQLYINTLIKEYTEAKEYFKRNGQEQLANKSRQDLRILISAKQKVDSGRYKEVKLNALPKAITPEYIYGYTENERMQKFKNILSQLIKDKNDIDEKMKSILEKMKKLRKRELEKAKEAVKPKLDEMKKKKDNIAKLIDILKEKFKDKWTPAPLYEKVMVEDRIEKISYEGAIFGLKIHVGKTDYDKDKTYLKIALQVNQNKVLGKQVHLKQMGDYNEEWKWEFNGDEFKSIAKNYLYVELYRQHTFSDDKKGQGKIDLGNIRKGNSFKAECKIEIESKRVEPTIIFLITPIMPEGKKIYETIQKESIKITKIYPAFTGKQQVELSSGENTQATNQQPKTVVVQKKQNIPSKPNNNNNTNVNANQPKIDKDKFKAEELADIDIIENLNTLKVLEFKIKELEAKMKKIDGRTPREMLQKKVKMTCKKKQLEEGMGDGSVSPQEYMELMKATLEHDQLLAIYMKQNNEEEKYKNLMGRIALIKQEMGELKSYIK